MNKKIAVIGSLTIDNVTYTNEIPVPGKTVVGENFISNVGGKGANQACAAKFLGSDVLFFGARGKDNNGDIASKFLLDNGLKFYLKRSESPTGVATIIIDNKTAENRIVIVPGANNDVNKTDVDYWTSVLKDCSLLICQFENPIESVFYALKKANEMGLTTILNPAPFHQFDKKYLEFVDFFVPNEHELDDFIPGEMSHLEKAKVALSYGVKNVIVTLGEKGSLLVNIDEEVHIEAYKVDAIDTTGAGDSFIGAFAHRLNQGYSVVDSMKFASYCSSLTVTKRGAIISLPHIEDIEF